MLVLLFADAVELQVDAVLPGGLCRFAELDVFGKANSVGRREDAIEANLPGVSYSVEIVRRKRRFTA